MSGYGPSATNFSLGPDVSFRGEAEVGQAAESAALVENETHLRSGGCIAAVETMSILAAGEEPTPATQRITPRAFALPVQSNGLLRQEIVD
jgi:hypothetical protein